LIRERYREILLDNKAKLYWNCEAGKGMVLIILRMMVVVVVGQMEETKVEDLWTVHPLTSQHNVRSFVCDRSGRSGSGHCSDESWGKQKEMEKKCDAVVDHF
jgi:hypothetical protein